MTRLGPYMVGGPGAPSPTSRPSINCSKWILPYIHIILLTGQLPSITRECSINQYNVPKCSYDRGMAPEYMSVPKCFNGREAQPINRGMAPELLCMKDWEDNLPLLWYLDFWNQWMKIKPTNRRRVKSVKMVLQWKFFAPYPMILWDMSHPGDAQGQPIPHQGHFLLPSTQHTLQEATLQPRGAALWP